MKKMELIERMVAVENNVVYGEEFTEYDSGDFGDVVNEISDGQVSIYTSDLEKWLTDSGSNSYEYMKRVVEEGFIDTKEYDFTGHIRAAQYLQVNDSINSELDELKKLALYKALESSGDWEKVLLEDLDNLEDDVDSCDSFEEIEYAIQGLLESYED